MKYYLGPWRWRIDGSESYWCPPDGFSALDLRPLHEQAALGGTPGLGIFVGTGDPGKDYAQLGSGGWQDIKSSQRLRDMLPGKYRPQGDDLLGLILDLFTLGADPDGIDGPKPILPTSRGRIELHCGGRSHYERFAWGDKFTPKVRDVLRRDFARTMSAAEKGDLNDAEHHRRVLDAQCEKYRVADWKEFVPPELQTDVPGRLKHETTYTDNFNRASIGAGWGTLRLAGVAISSSTVATSGGAGFGAGRYESDLSSDDHVTSMSVISRPTLVTIGVLARCSTSDESNYAYTERDGATPTRRLFKRVVTTDTVLASDSTAAAGLPHTIAVTCDGSDISAAQSGTTILSQTDTAITGNLRGGMQFSANTTTADDWSTSDLAASGLLYTQLERSTRGVCRGMFTKW